MRLSDVQIAQVAANAGFSGDALVTAVAIALAESGGDAGNTSGDGGTSWGLWQIHWTVHPQFNKSQLLDPDYNAAAAYQLSGSGTNFYPWSTWRFGQYKAKLVRAQAAVAAIGGAGAGTDAGLVDSRITSADGGGVIVDNWGDTGSDLTPYLLLGGGLLLLLLLASD